MKPYPAHKILVIALRRIGDVLLVTPLLRSLRQFYPNAIIDLLVYSGKGDILIGNPDYNHLIFVAERPNFREYKILLQQIFRRYDLAISTLAGDRPILYALLAAPHRVAIVPPARWQDAWKRWFTHAWTELDDKTTHTVIQNLQLADLLAIPRHYQVVPPVTPDAHQLVNSLLPFSRQQQYYVVLHLLPLYHYKRWTVSGWQKLIHFLLNLNVQVVVTGGNDAAERNDIQAIISHLPVVNLAGQLKFSEVTDLIRHCILYVGPDTAVTHLAAATGVSTIALYGPTNHLKWAPWPADYAENQSPFISKGGVQQVGNVTLIQGLPDCVPCHQEGCERHLSSKSRCLEELDSMVVIQVVQNLLSLTLKDLK